MENSHINIKEVEICQLPDFKQACDILRHEIGALDGQVIGMCVHPAIGKVGNIKAVQEVFENLALAHRHLEDARMRIGKVIQHSESRESIFDIQKDPEKVGKLAYQRFCEVGGTDWDTAGDHWDAMGESEKKGWIAAGSAGQPVSQ